MTIYAYGDSFIANRGDPNTDLTDGWAVKLSKKLNTQLINRGVSGGSTENAALNFMNDLDLNLIQNDDIVIFQLSTPGRLHFKFQIDRPETASVYWHDIAPGDPRHVWYYENKHHIQWYIRNHNENIGVMNHNAYIHTVRNFAENNPKIKVVLMQNTTLPQKIKLPATGNNFIEVPIDLDKISKNEYVRPFDFNEWNQFTKYDVRVNHFSNTNLNKMADLVFESLQTCRADNFSYDKFDQKIFDVILSKQDHDRYVAQGLIYDMSFMFDGRR